MESPYCLYKVCYFGLKKVFQHSTKAESDIVMGSVRLALLVVEIPYQDLGIKPLLLVAADKRSLGFRGFYLSMGLSSSSTRSRPPTSPTVKGHTVTAVRVMWLKAKMAMLSLL